MYRGALVAFPYVLPDQGRLKGREGKEPAILFDKGVNHQIELSSRPLRRVVIFDISD